MNEKKIQNIVSNRMFKEYDIQLRTDYMSILDLERSVFYP